MDAKESKPSKTGKIVPPVDQMQLLQWCKRRVPV
jgi:hypothetical protein